MAIDEPPVSASQILGLQAFTDNEYHFIPTRMAINKVMNK
jgi:hypothetical protein